MRLSEEQVAFALAVQADMEEFGSALVLSSDVRDQFSPKLMAEVVIGNCWNMVYDSVLDVARFTQLPGEKTHPIDAFAEDIIRSKVKAKLKKK